MSIDDLYAAMQLHFYGSPAWKEPKTIVPIDLSRIPPKPWPWPRTMTDSEIADYEALLGGEYRITRAYVTWRGDYVFGEPR